MELAPDNMRCFVLDENKVARPVSLLDWAKALEKSRHEFRDTTRGVTVSTVFLGLDHSYSEEGPPILFETMVFGGRHDGHCERCSTYEEARAQHERVLGMVKVKKTQRETGQENLENVRWFMKTHVGATHIECAEALSLTVFCVGRHIRTLRAEWGGHKKSKRRSR